MSKQPLVTLFVMAYRQAHIIAETIEGAFAQTYAPLEIILSDDCSPDETFAIMERMAAEYCGPHTIRLNRNTRNLGFVGHLNHIFEISRGELIVYNPGGDVSEPDRVEKLVRKALENDALLVHSDVREIEADGTLTDRIASRQPSLDGLTLDEAKTAMTLCIGATCAWHPDIVRIFGPIREAGTFDDLVFYFRALLLGRVAHVPQPLMRYRLDEGLSKVKGPTVFLPQTAERQEAYLRRMKLRAATMSQRLADCRAIGRDDIAASMEYHVTETCYTVRLLENPGFDWLSRFRSLDAFARAQRARRRIRVNHRIAQQP